jgi:uncharacterized protein (TIGR00725 family)
VQSVQSVQSVVKVGKKMGHLLVAVIGAAVCSPAQAEAAETVGRVLAEGGATILCGGRGGVMEAACRGAHSVGGLTVGILPGDDPGAANPYVDIAIATGLGEARNAIVARTAQAVVAIGGRYGTLSEIAFALKRGLPVVGMNTWKLAPLEGDFSIPIVYVDDPVEAARRALALARGG